MESTASDLLVEVKTGVMTLTLNRPESLNSFSPVIIEGLKESLTKAKEDANIKVVVLKGAGRAFSAGGDVKRMGSGSPLGTYEHIGKLNELIVQMSKLEKPIIAAVHGYAAGAGFNLALASDLILAEEDSKFILSFSKVGLISDGGGLYHLPRLIGLNKAKELFFHAEPLSVDEAYKLGIVNQIYAKELFAQKVEAYAQKLAEGPSLSYGFIKKIANQSFSSTLEEVLEQERITQATMVTTNDHLEGVQAFKEKRTPKFGQ
ncbi:enoyl-CoA hydratase [Bacillus sp. CRN 9]|nr:enoyl-CoA hydratase [Bacillus sp. CRN 9]